MAEGYKKIFWGIVISTFHVTIGMLTILPPFIGWIVVLTGISELEQQKSDEIFSSSKKGTLVLIILSLASVIISFLGNRTMESFIVIMFFPLIAEAIELVVFHKILEASVYHFSQRNQQETASIYISKDKTYIVLMAIVFLLIAIAVTFNLATMNMIGAVAAIISRIYLLTIMNALSKEEYKMEDITRSLHKNDAA